MKSKLFNLNVQDIVKTLIMVVLGAFSGAALDVLVAVNENNPLDLGSLLRTAGIAAGIAGLSYLVKNVFTGTNDKLFTNK